MKKLTKAIALAGAMSVAAFAQADDHGVEVSASAAVSNMYLWRGTDLGQGTGAISGDLTASMGGAYAGVWVSSGDIGLGQEYDLYVGFGGEVEDFSYDISVWSYVYPGVSLEDGETEGNTFETSELILSGGFMGLAASYYHTVSSNPDDYSYLTLGYGVDAYSVTLGMAMDDVDSGYTHVDLGYAYNDNLSFTLSKIIDEEAEGTEDAQDDDLKIAVTYSLPIDL
ncbi:MAG: TorF family putative porin [Pseudomonadota bacterium]|nr:TorF family putative porin [Pseudomonadota bacterium]